MTIRMNGKTVGVSPTVDITTDVVAEIAKRMAMMQLASGKAIRDAVSYEVAKLVAWTLNAKGVGPYAFRRTMLRQGVSRLALTGDWSLA